jgi:hypothetical protein
VGRRKVKGREGGREGGRKGREGEREGKEGGRREQGLKGETKGKGNAQDLV